MIHTYWQNLKEREQWMVAIGGVACLIYLFYLLIYSPLSTAVTQHTVLLQEQRDTFTWMQQTKQANRQSHPAAKTIDNGKLLSLIASEFNKPNFKAFTYDLQQTGAGDIQLNVEKIPYNQLVKWLRYFSLQYKIHIKVMRIERTPQEGIVKLSLNLESLP